MTHDFDKRAAALAAIEEVRPGMIVGLGTGSTVAFAIDALGARELDIRCVATSEATATRASAVGLALIALPETIDLAIDGADEIDAAFHAIKGGGGAMLREKIVAAASRRMVVIADGSKRVARIGGVPVPVEILPFAATFVVARLRALGGAPAARTGFVTVSGNHILDCHFPRDTDHLALADEISRIPGALGHGLFLTEVSAAYIASGGIVTRLERASARR